MKRMLVVAAQDGLDRPKGSPGDHGSRRMHSAEGRDVAGSDPRGSAAGRILGEAADDREVRRLVDRLQFIVRGGLRREPGLGSYEPKQVDRGSEATRRKRMRRPEIVRLGAWPEDEQRATAVRHRGTIPAMERVYTAPRLDKLGVRPGVRVAIVGIDDPTFAGEVGERTLDVTLGPPLPDTDLIFLGADAPADLAALAGLRASIRPNGAIWVVSRKGPAATLRDTEVMAAARAADLVDNKVVAFSATHTSLRLVIPVAMRPP